MKKGLLVVLFAVFFLFLQPTFMGVNAASTENSDFIKSVNEKLKEVNYYDEGSVQVVDSISKKTEVTKVITTDDPSTEENEEEIETYEANVVVASVEYKLKRDSLFYLQKHDFFFFDVDKKEFLMLSNVANDKEISTLYNEYIENLEGAGFTLSSNLLATCILLLTVLVAPLLIMVFHNKSIPTPMIRKNSVY
ncbi:hypothetical protein ACLM5H_03930 [Fredinandcohnia humi]